MSDERYEFGWTDPRRLTGTAPPPREPWLRLAMRDPICAILWMMLWGLLPGILIRHLL